MALRLPLALTVILALAFLGVGIRYPALNFDLIPYATLAKEMRGAGGKNDVYRELAARVDSEKFKTYVSAPYQARMYHDDAFFEKNLPFYKTRVLYISLCAATGWLIGSDVAATHVVSAIAAALAVLLSYAIFCNIGAPAGVWRIAVPVSWGIAGGLCIAELSTPDALAALVGLLFVQAWLADRWTGERALRLILLAGLLVATRTDQILLVAPLLLCEWFLEPRHRRVAGSALFVAAASYFAIQAISGNYGYLAVLNLTVIDGPQKLLVPDLALNLPGYLRAVARGILVMFGDSTGGGQGGQFLLPMSFLIVTACREWSSWKSATANGLSRRVFVLSCALMFFLAAHFMLFPEPWVRFVMGAQVLATLLFVRTVLVRVK